MSLQRRRRLVVAGLGGVDRVRHRPRVLRERREEDGRTGIAERIPGVGVLELHEDHELARARLRDLGGLGAVRPVQGETRSSLRVRGFITVASCFSVPEKTRT